MDTLCTGFSEFIAPWNTIDISAQRNAAAPAGDSRQDVDRVAVGRVVDAPEPPADHTGRWQQPGHPVRERGLATAALAGQPQHLAPVQGQVDVADGVHRRVAQSVVDDQTADLEHGRFIRRLPSAADDDGRRTGRGSAAARTGVKPTRIRTVRPSTRS